MARASQPTWDFISGTEPPPPSRLPVRDFTKASTASKAGDINNDDLRAQLRTVQYELDSLKQERELTELRHQQDLRDVQSRAEGDFKRAQTAEGANNVATKKAEALARDFQEVQDRAANEKMQLEKKIRSLQEDNRALREDLEDAQAELSTHQRQSKYELGELEQKHATLQASVEDIQQDLSGKVSALQMTQQKLVQKEAEVGQLENEVLRLKAQAGDSDTLAVIKKELSEQVAYIKKLETTNREQLAEIKQFRKLQKGIEVVEEEKRGLETKVRMMDDLRKELAEAQLQKRILEDEKKSWTSYLENEATVEEDLRYDTPEQMAKAFLRERLERLNLVDKLGGMQPELSVKDESIRELQEEKARLQSEMEKLRGSSALGGTAPAADSKARAQVERQKNLAMKEIEYLRAQIKTFEAEEAEFTPEQVDEGRASRVRELEELVDQYRSEVQTLQADLSKIDPQPAAASPKKRSREEDEESDERLGELRRKTRTLQDELDKLQSRNQLLEAELKASASQVTSLHESARTRVLELRNNPTAEAEAVKMSTLRTLRNENAALLEQISGKSPRTKVVPISTLEDMRHQLDEMKTHMAQGEKKTMRLKQIWAAKALEFREAVCSILGWKLDFMPNGRVKATSILYPSLIHNGEEEENSIVFDGENGTMKVSGGPKSMFAGEIRGLIEFWVEGRKEIPCFLAACTLEFYERTTRAQKM